MDELQSQPSEEPRVDPAPSHVDENQSAAAQPSKPLETDTKLFAAISYLSILFVIPWIVRKDHPYVAFHIKQGMALFFAEAVVWVVLWLMESFLTVVFSYHAAGIVVWLNKLAWLVFAAVSLVGVYYALKGESKPLPYLAAITKNIKL